MIVLAVTLAIIALTLTTTALVEHRRHKRDAWMHEPWLPYNRRHWRP